MKKFLLTAVGLLMLTVASAQKQPAEAPQSPKADYSQVLPEPQSINLQKGQPFVLNASTPIVATPGEANERNAQFLRQYITDLTGLVLPVIEKGNLAITLKVDPRAKHIADEGYTIKVSRQGITVTGKTPAGVFYGVQTLRKSLPMPQPCCGQKQACDSAKAEPSCCAKTPKEILFPAATIADQPRFGYRGMMLDCSRHFFTVDFVKQYIDMLALHNMNRFHWHLTDDQGWRFVVDKYPRLVEVGSKRAATVMGRNSELEDGVPYGGYYTDAEIRDIVKYAQERYITIVPEIDMPGHMMAALAAYPELGCRGKGYETGRYWGVYRDILCAGNEKTYEFIQAVLDKVCELFPGEYIHIGGDEAPRMRWEVCPKDQAKIAELGLTDKPGQSKEAQLQGYFAQRVQTYLEGKGRKIIGWDELLDCGVDSTATIMSWRGGEPGAKGAEAGHDIIMTPTSHCYFDYLQSDERHIEPTICFGLLPIKQVYDWDPAPDSLSVKAQRHILGAQANLWTEYIVNEPVAEYQVLPRMAALAEVQWMKQSARTFEGFTKRATSLRRIYERYGWHYAHHLWPDEFRKKAKEY